MPNISVVNPRKKAKRKQTPAQRAASKRNIKKAQAARRKSTRKTNPTKRKKSASKRRTNSKRRKSTKRKATRRTNPKRRKSTRRKATRRNPPKRRAAPRRRRRNPTSVTKGLSLPISNKTQWNKKFTPKEDLPGLLIGGLGGAGLSGIVKVVSGNDAAGTVVHGIYWIGGSVAMNRYSKTKKYARGFFIGAAISFAADLISTMIRSFSGTQDDYVSLYDLEAVGPLDKVKTVILKGVGNPQEAIGKVLPGLSGSSDIWDLYSGDNGEGQIYDQEYERELQRNNMLKSQLAGMGVEPEQYGIFREDDQYEHLDLSQ